MKKILGLDLGTNSIGWAVVNADENWKPISIERLGSRIVPLSSDDTNEFTKGNAISKNQSRTENGLHVKDMIGISCVENI